MIRIPYHVFVGVCGESSIAVIVYVELIRMVS